MYQKCKKYFFNSETYYKYSEKYFNLYEKIPFNSIEPIYFDLGRRSNHNSVINIDWRKYLIKCILEDENGFNEKLENKKIAKKVIERYSAFVNDIGNSTKEIDYSGDISYRFYSKVEKKIIYKEFVKRQPYFDSQNVVVLHVNYTSPAGRVCDDKKRGYSFYELEDVLDEVKTIDKNKKRIAAERALLTPSLRYDILNRDHNRCVICGRSSQDGVKLHVDHIKPVSKGGKTELSNLQTLCEDCNLGKGAKYDDKTYIL